MFWGSMNEIARAVREIPTDRIEVPVSPRSLPEGSPEYAALRALADGIREHGTVEPLLVCAGKGEKYILTAGERRLTAARTAGRKSVPCVVTDAPENGEDGMREAVVLAVVENIHREDLNLFESAAAISVLLALTGLTQEQCARRLGVSQSYVANKLRLLRLTEEERRLMLDSRLTERHGRALLRFPTPEERAPVLRAMIAREMNVASAEDYVESLLCADARANARAVVRDAASRASASPGDANARMLLRDARRFTDSIDKAVDVVRRSGIPVEASRRDTPSGTLISILLPKSS